MRSFAPWFIVGFLLMVAARSLGALPVAALPILARAAAALTVVSMAALGLGTDMRAVARAGGRVTGTMVLSLLVLGLASLGLIHVLRVG